jgi:cytochrome c peroxidase
VRDRREAASPSGGSWVSQRAIAGRRMHAGARRPALRGTQSRWDKYLGGDKAALTTEEKAGLKVFTNVGCMVCHTGEMLGGDSFQKLGSVEAWLTQTDQGRFEFTKRVADRHATSQRAHLRAAVAARWPHQGRGRSAKTHH